MLLSLTDHLVVGGAVQLAFEGLGSDLSVLEARLARLDARLPPTNETSMDEYRKLKNGVRAGSTTATSFVQSFLGTRFRVFTGHVAMA